MNLTTLARAKQYLAGAVAFTGSDAVYTALIASASVAAANFCSRTFQRASYTGLRLNGNGGNRLMPPSNPIISVSAISVDGKAIAASADAIAAGYQYDSKWLYLFGGYVFTMGNRNIQVSMVTGYDTTETAFIPAATPYTLTPVTGNGISADGSPEMTNGPATADRGVTFVSNGVSLVLVGSAPTTGQYAFSDGVYTFAAADAGQQVTMTYSYTPADVEQAVIDTVGTWMKQRNNLGVASVTLNGETVSYRDTSLSKTARMLLQPYRWSILP